MRILSPAVLALLVLAVLSTLSTAASADGFDSGHIGGLEVRKHRTKHRHHHHHHHTTTSTRRHHKKPTEPTGRKKHKGDNRPHAGETPKTTKKKKHHHKTTTTTTRKKKKNHPKPTATTTTTKKKPKTTTTTTTAAPKPVQTDTSLKGTHKYGLIHSDKIRGVNLGNWLVVESWMDPRLQKALNDIAVNAPASVMKKTKNQPVIDEYSIGLYTNHAKASVLLREHFDHWMAEKDWRRIAKYGLNTVRIPFPHYAFADCVEEGAPFLTLNRVEKLKEGVLLAKKYGLKVWISLHSLPGSQNGYDSSGRIGNPGWAESPEYAALSKKAFNHLVSIFSQEPYASAVLAIEPANEPTAAQDADILDTLRKFYPVAYDIFANAQTASRKQTTQASSHPIKFAAHDGWKGMGYWSKPEPFWPEEARKNMFLGMHPYYIFGDVVHNMTDSQRIAKACTFGQKMANYSDVYNIVVSECGINAPRGDNGWGRDMHQADWLQFDDPELEYPFSDEYMRFLALNFRAQQQAYERNGAGWMIWSWKHYRFRDWSYKSGVRYGWLPRNAAELDKQPFGNLCP